MLERDQEPKMLHQISYQAVFLPTPLLPLERYIFSVKIYTTNVCADHLKFKSVCKYHVFLLRLLMTKICIFSQTL